METIMADEHKECLQTFSVILLRTSADYDDLNHDYNLDNVFQHSSVGFMIMETHYSFHDISSKSKSNVLQFGGRR